MTTRRPRLAAAPPLSAEEQRVVDTVRRDGLAILHNLLTPNEIDAARTAFDALQLEASRGHSDDPENAGARTVICTCQHVPVGRNPALVANAGSVVSAAPASLFLGVSIIRGEDVGCQQINRVWVG